MFARQIYAVVLILAASGQCKLKSLMNYLEIYPTLSPILVTSAAPNPSCSKKYKVKKGDSCIKISQEQRVSTCVFGLYGRFTDC